MTPKELCSLFMFLWLIVPPSVIAQLAKPGCIDACGGVHIPFPFGIGEGCYLSDWFAIDCRPSSEMSSSKPYLTKLNLEVMRVLLYSPKLYVNSPVKYFCQKQIFDGGAGSVNLTGSPFYFTDGHNMTLFGCGKALLYVEQNSKPVRACESTCQEGDFNGSKTSDCNGVGCCESAIPFYFSDSHFNFTSLGFNNSGFCSFAILRCPYHYPDLVEGSFPLELLWTIQESELFALPGCNPDIGTIQLSTGDTTVRQCRPNCAKFGMNPYLSGRCQPEGSYFWKKKNWTATIASVTSSLGLLFLVSASFMSYKLLKRRKDKKIKEKFFKRNGGLLLQKQLSADDSIIEKIRIFTTRECEKATDNFNDNRILGRGGQGTVYKGMLADGKIIAIKRSKQVNKSQLGQFINEVLLLSQIVHKNVIKLLGCCLETEVPLLIYEFIPNGTLYDLIHSENDEFLTWNIRLRIATEIADALAYLHSAISIPICPRDIKSSNILLDEKYIAKVSDFRTSMFIASDKTHITTLVKGTFGYLDPEYFQSSQFTEKSDVYSFGVVLVELLTRKKVISSIRAGEDGNLSLVARFLESMEENSLDNILDAQILAHNNTKEIIAAARLAQLCLNLNGKKRPSMREVASELERIKLLKTNHRILSNFQSLGCIKEESMELSAAHSTWTIESSSRRSSSNIHPLLFNTL